MMSAPSLPTPQGKMPAGFATFLANIGQLPDGSESPGFDQLLAAAPVVAAPAANATATIKTGPAPAVDAEAAQIDMPPLEDAVSVEAPVVKAEPAKADAATLAATLLIALGGSAPGPATTPGKPAPAETEADTAPDTAEAGATAAPTADLAAVAAAAIPAAAKPAKPVEASQIRADTDTAAAPATARPRDAAAPLPILTGAEAPAAKPADAAPSMTILFTQPAAQGAGVAAATAPVQLAERVLDMDSDGAWIDQLARDIAATKSDSGDISFRLMPRHLGRLDVAMQMGGEGIALKMDTQHEATATIVTAAQGRLVEELRQQGVRVAGAEVTCTPGETGRQSPNQNQGQGRGTAPDPAHLIETATQRAEPRDEDRAADRRGRFA
ncbi:flagellar hook-length control protein FliK [Sphingopyxis italica]